MNRDPRDKSLPLFVENKEFNWAIPQTEPGETCSTCIYYHLRTPLVPNQLPPPIAIDDGTTLSNPVVVEVRRVPRIVGYCTWMLTNAPEPTIVINVPKDNGCGHYTEKEHHLQFYDSALTDDEDPYDGPIAPTVIGGV